MRLVAVAADARDNVRGAVAMVLGMAAFVTNDLFIKLASETLPTGQSIFLRGVFATLFLSTLVVATGAHRDIARIYRPSVGLRSLGEVMSTTMYLTALFHIPIATATAILQAMPILMTIVAALVLGEVVRWRRWMAVAIGFIGMLMIVQPGAASFSPYSLLALAALGFIALRDFATRYIPLHVSALLVGTAASVAVTIAGALMVLMEGWIAPTAQEIAYLAAAGACLTAGSVFLVDAMRRGEMSVIAPFRYTILLWALLYGYFVWGEIPNLLGMTGFALIVLSGTYVFYREGRVRRERRTGAGTSIGRQ